MSVLDEAKTWDVLVVGAGPAGCAAAYDLAARGWQVLLVDKAEFPRPKACAGGLTLKALRALRYPVDPVVRRWVSSMVLEENDRKAVTVGRKTAVCAMTVREELDAFCLQKTIDRGVSFERVPRIVSLLQEAGQAGSDARAGVTVRFDGNCELRARYVIGADGVHSQIRRLVAEGETPAGADLSAGSGWFRRAFAVEANVAYQEPGETYPLTFDFAPVRGGYGWVFPRDTHVNVGLYVEELPTGTRGGESAGERVNAAGLERYIALRCGAGRTVSRPIGQFLGLGAENYQPAAGTHVFLAGDAAGFVDPLTGEGIYGAIRSGQVAAEAVNAGLRAAAIIDSDGDAACRAYEEAVAGLRADLRLARRAADTFYAEPARGFALMRLPLVGRTVLRIYGEGIRLEWMMRGLRGIDRFRRAVTPGERKSDAESHVVARKP